jgi:hypothetical protein
MIKGSWGLRRPEQPDLKMLQALVWSHRPAFHAVVGLSKGWEVAAVADALRDSVMGGKTYNGYVPNDRLRCFHWGWGLRQTKDLIRSLDYRGRQMHRPCRLEHVMSFVPAGEDYAGWRAVLEDWVPYGQRFGLVVHVGIGKSLHIRRHLIELMPMMNHRTTIVLCGMQFNGPHERFYTMLRKGWDGVRIGNLGILQRLSRQKG